MWLVFLVHLPIQVLQNKYIIFVFLSYEIIMNTSTALLYYIKRAIVSDILCAE